MTMDRKINFNDDDGDEEISSLFDMQVEFNNKFYELVKAQCEACQSTFDQTQDILKTMADALNQMKDEVAALRGQFQLIYEHKQSMSEDIGLIKLKLKIDPYE
jgi:tRNA U54 and U55 pseudouridine synthase Pus10